MNHSLRKQIERLMADAPDPGFDPFRLRPLSFAGIDIVESPSRPRYELPKEVLPGIPWPPGFREDFNRWSLSFLGTVNVVPRGTAYMIAGRIAVMHPSDVVKLTNLC